jgi:hypothetical protein
MKTNRLNKRTPFVIALLFFHFIGFTQTQTFTTSGSFTVPAGVTSLTVEAWGGGGAGGGATGNPSAGGGGAGGAYVKNTSLSVTPGASYTVIVGAKQNGTINTGQNGNPSSLALTATPAVLLINAVGGNGGSLSSTNINSAAGGTAVATGNIGGTSSDIYGLCGLMGTGTGGSIGGDGGASAGGATGGLGSSTTTPNDGNLYGGGGSGGKTTNGTDKSGGNGAAGQVIINWSCPVYSLSSTAAVSPICSTNTTNVSVSSLVTDLPIGTYTVTYNLTGTNSATGSTALMVVTTAGSGSFNTSALATAGATTITITSLSSGGTSPNNCGTTISTNNSASVTVNSNPTITATSPGTRVGTGTVTLGATASSGIISWFATLIGGSALATGTSYTTPSISSSTTYYVETYDGLCTSLTRTAVIASITNPEINVQGNSISIIDGDVTAMTTDGTNFGSVEVSSGNLKKTFTIQNTGNSSLTIGAISFSGANSSEFTISTAPAATINGGSSSTFIVSFDPNATGTRTATISIVNDDSDENPYDFSIQGTGIQSFFDSDGDGVYDNDDADDDNDGIKDATEESNCKNVNGYNVNYKFLNETFGEGTTRTQINTTYNATTTYSYQDATTPTDVEGSGLSVSLNDGKYTVGTSAQIASWAAAYWYMGGDHTAGDTNGRMALFNASYTPGIFYTALITGALPNLPITYSFWVINLDRSDAPGIATRLRPNIKVEFRDINDVVLQTINTGDIAPTSVSNAAGDWYQFTSNLTLNVNAFKVIFINNKTGGTGNDLALDDILITQTLCDRDGDGIADVFDLDADNDGIEDVIEAGLGNISNGKGKIDVAWIDSNGNGLHDNSESVAALPALDSDGDGIPNYIDLDSDNDSLFDVDESGVGNTNAATGFVNGDGDINGDGRGDGPESETFRSKDTNGDTIIEGFGDGILDLYDYGTGSTFSSQYGNLNQGISNANPATTYLKDSDSDGIPDYLDVKSNGVTFDIANTLLIYDYKTLDTNNNGIIDGTTDADKDGILDAFDTNTAYFGSPRDLQTKLFLDFDGRNDYGQSTSILGGLSSASLMAWIDLNPAFSTDGVIVGQDKFQIRINNSKKLEAIVNGTTFTYNTALTVSQWYNVAATYDGANLKLYVNGTLVLTQAKTGAIAADASLLTIGRNPIASDKYFKGKIDEVRVFNVGLTDSQLQRMVYQEIQNSGSEIRGLIVPKNIATSPASLPFTNLLRYYRMDTYKDDIIDDLTTPATDLTGAKIYNNKNIYVQQAPMPFLTERTGNFATAVNSPAREIRGQDIMDFNYSIVKVQHDITESSNNIDIGMFVNPGIKIVMKNDTKLQNDWYLKLDGKIDLVGKSQLIQTTESDLDVTSAGSIERDQQGQSNKFNYNYWSSPVSPINSTSNNNNYSVDGVLRDGTNPATPVTINWVSGYDGSPTSPKISLARYWLYKFDNYSNQYANWVQILETAPIRVGQGFTLKGSGATGLQNYTFVGKPNNGLINSNTVASDQLLLTGNPYASALDATAFINDNSSTIDGTLYFWNHYSTNNTHTLADYQGGYAERNLTGGVAPTSAGIDFISGQGCSGRGIPNQYIPVGQGFFVNGKIGTGGTVTFKNSQRGFYKEDDLGVSNIMYKKRPSATKPIHLNDNSNDPIVKDTLMKIRLGFNSNNNYHRQVLLGFMNEKATSEMDYGYDGLNLDDFPNDMYFLNGENQLVIQGEGYFDAKASYPIGVKTAVEGKVSFMIDALENFDTNQNIFIYDDETKIHNNIQNKPFEVNLPVGVNDTRFSLRFINKTINTEKTLSVDDDADANNEFMVFYSKNYKTLIIKNNNRNATVNSVSLFNILGQSIEKWDVDDIEQTNIQIPIKNISTGIYVVKIKTSNGNTNKKIIIN